LLTIIPLLADAPGFYLRLRRTLYSVAGDIGQIFFKKIIQVITVFLEGKFFLA
jgi:hypothetical protein